MIIYLLLQLWQSSSAKEGPTCSTNSVVALGYRNLAGFGVGVLVGVRVGVPVGVRVGVMCAASAEDESAARVWAVRSRSSKAIRSLQAE